MIYTVTLNPSVDYVVNLDRLVSGITNRTTDEKFYFGGKGINVSRVLAELDVESTVLGFVGGFTGEEIEKSVAGEKIHTDFIKLSQGNSRINIKINAGVETEINCQGPRIEEHEFEKLLKKIDRVSNGDTLVLAGSVPSSLPDDVYETIIKRTVGKDVRIVVDASKKLLLNSLKYSPFLIKPNRQELCEIFGSEIRSLDDVEKYAKELQFLGAKNVLVSLGADGAVLIDENGNKLRAEVLNGKVIGTVGSGDSMVAGFIAGFEKRRSYSYALKLGSVCANATAFSDGLATKKIIDKLLGIID